MAAQCAHCNGLMIKKYLDDTARGDFPCLVCGLVCKTYTQYKGHMREIKSTAYPVLSLLQQQDHDKAWYGNDETEAADHTLKWGASKNHEDETEYEHEGGDYLNGNGKLLLMG